MKKREVKRNIENKVLKLELTNETIDDIYESLPKIIKICNKKYMIKDGYTSYLIAKEFGLKQVEVYIIE